MAGIFMIVLVVASNDAKPGKVHGVALSLMIMSFYPLEDWCQTESSEFTQLKDMTHRPFHVL